MGSEPLGTNETLRWLKAYKATVQLTICNFSNRKWLCDFMDFQECIPNAIQALSFHSMDVALSLKLVAFC